MLQQTWFDVISEIGYLFQYLTNINIYGIPVLHYFVGIAVLGLIIDYVFG